MAGTMTRDDFVTEICDIVGKSTNASAVSATALQTRVRTYLNFAQRRIARHHDFYELQDTKTNAATVASTKNYPLESGTNNLGLTRPKDIYSITLLDGADSWRLERWSAQKFDLRFPEPTNYAEGRPTLYVRWGSDIQLFRIPDAAYTLSIRYSKWPTPFSSATQTTDYDNKDELVLIAGVVETYMALEEYSDAAAWISRFTGLLRDARLAEGDVDWEPDGEPFKAITRLEAGRPWLDPSGSPNDPLFNIVD